MAFSELPPGLSTDELSTLGAAGSTYCFHLQRRKGGSESLVASPRISLQQGPRLRSGHFLEGLQSRVGHGLEAFL